MSAFALLAPVPLKHLQSGELACRKHGTVAFATRAWDVFSELDVLRGGSDGPPVDVFIYASHDSTNGQLEVSWRGHYTKYHPANGGKPPASVVRPHSTEQEDAAPFDLKTSPTGFWELNSLGPIPIGEREPLSAFIAYGTNKGFAKHFVPEGPIIVVHP